MKRRMILVIDEDETTIDLIDSTLNSPFQVLRVREGKRAIELACQGNFEIAIVARCLPDIDGLAVLKTLTLKVPSIKVIFVAFAPTKELIITAFRSGAKDIIEKPIDPDALLESIERVTIGKNQDIPVIEDKHVVPGNHRLFAFSPSLQFPAFPWLIHAVKHLSDFFTHPHGSGHARENQAEHNDLLKVEEVSESVQVYEGHAKEQAALTMYCLGKFRVILNGEVIENWTNRKGRELFTFLVMNHNRRTYRDILMDTFWQNSDPDSARNSMNVTIHYVRNALHKVNPGYEYILFKEECYFLNPEIEIWADVEEFLKYWKIAQSIDREKGIREAVGEYETAAALYKGDFMVEDLYESWPASERENMKEIYLYILDRLSEFYFLDGKPSTAAGLCETILEKDNCREDIHRRLMLCYYRLEQRDKAARQYRKCVEALKTELEVEPTHATIELYEQIKQGSLSKQEKIKNS